MTVIICILLCVIQEKHRWGDQHSKLLKPRRTRYYSINIRFIVADVSATYFDISSRHLHAYMKQQRYIFEYVSAFII
jgi:hypothetical protein